MLLQAADLGADFGRDVQRFRLVREDDIDVAPRRATDRDLDERSPTRLNHPKEVLDDLALDPIVDARSRVWKGTNRQVGTEHVGDPNEDGGARLGGALLDAAKVRPADPDGHGDGRLAQCGILS